MYKFALTVCLHVTVFSNVLCKDDFELDAYYWRDYIGKIPNDAIPGGKNSYASTTYIGQVLHRSLLIPAEIDTDLKTAAYEWGYKGFSANDTKRVKILCSPVPHKFEWIPTGNKQIEKIYDQNLVLGGYENEAHIYIGRKEINGRIAIGKIISGPVQSTLNIVEGEQGTQHGSFDVLRYNPSKTESDTDVKLDNNKHSKCTVRRVNIKLFN